MGCLIQSTWPEEMCDLQAAQPPPDSAFLKGGGKMKADLSGQNQKNIL